MEASFPMREQPRGCTGVQLVPDTLCVWGSRFWTAPAWAKGHLRSVYVLSLLRDGCRLTHPVPQRASSPLCPEWAEGTLQWGAERSESAHRSVPVVINPSLASGCSGSDRVGDLLPSPTALHSLASAGA